MEILKLFVQKWCDAPLVQVLLSPGWRQGHKHNLVIVLPLLCFCCCCFPPIFKAWKQLCSPNVQHHILYLAGGYNVHKAILGVGVVLRLAENAGKRVRNGDVC